MKISCVLIIIISGLYIAGCSSSQETENTGTESDSVYVFDSVPDTDTNEIKPLEYPDMGMTYYIVQIGAFTSSERAKQFAAESKQFLPYDIKTLFSRQNNLYVVQLSEYYTSRTEAEKVRNDLWKMEKFKDAWILTINK